MNYDTWERRFWIQMILALIIICGLATWGFVAYCNAGEATLVTQQCEIIKNGHVFSGMVPDVSYDAFPVTPSPELSPRESTHMRPFRLKKRPVPYV